MWDILYHAILLSYTKGGSNAACSNKDEPKDVIVREASQRKMMIVWYHLMWNVKN